MAQLNVIGRITSDFELKHSQNDNPYVRFDLAENIGSKDRARTQYYQVWAWGENALSITKARAKKGSFIYVSGRVELETYTKQDGFTIDKRLKVFLTDWSFVPIGNGGSKKQLPLQKSPETSSTKEVETINGDKDILPE